MGNTGSAVGNCYGCRTVHRGYSTQGGVLLIHLVLKGGGGKGHCFWGKGGVSSTGLSALERSNASSVGAKCTIIMSVCPAAPNQHYYYFKRGRSSSLSGPCSEHAPTPSIHPPTSTHTIYICCTPPIHTSSLHWTAGCNTACQALALYTALRLFKLEQAHL